MNEKKRRSLNMMRKYYGGGADDLKIVTRTSAGNIATFNTNLRRNLKSLIVNIQPLQAGSGTPSPTNVRPISGYDSVKIYRSGADTSNPTEYNISLSIAGTVYGGVLDVVNGTLTVTYGSITFDGTQPFTDRIAGQNRVYTQIPGMASKAMLNDPLAMCNMLPKATVIQNADHPCVCIGHETAGNYIYLQGVTYLDGVTDLATLNTYLADNPVMCTYELATPTTYTLTPTEIRTLIGTNNIWADAGPVSVEYYKEV